MKPEELGDFVEKARAMQSRLADLQRELSARRFEGSAGGGMVSAVVTGGLRVLELRVEPQLLESGDREMIQDLVAAAVNAALQTAQATVQQEIQRAGAALTPAGALGSD